MNPTGSHESAKTIFVATLRGEWSRYFRWCGGTLLLGLTVALALQIGALATEGFRVDLLQFGAMKAAIAFCVVILIPIVALFIPLQNGVWAKRLAYSAGPLAVVAVLVLEVPVWAPAAKPCCEKPPRSPVFASNVRPTPITQFAGLYVGVYPVDLKAALGTPVSLVDVSSTYSVSASEFFYITANISGNSEGRPDLGLIFFGDAFASPYAARFGLGGATAQYQLSATWDQPSSHDQVPPAPDSHAETLPVLSSDMSGGISRVRAFGNSEPEIWKPEVQTNCPDISADPAPHSGKPPSADPKSLDVITGAIFNTCFQR